MFKKSFSQRTSILLIASAAAIVLFGGILCAFYMMPPSPRIVEKDIPLCEN